MPGFGRGAACLLCFVGTLLGSSGVAVGARAHARSRTRGHRRPPSVRHLPASRRLASSRAEASTSTMTCPPALAARCASALQTPLVVPGVQLLDGGQQLHDSEQARLRSPYAVATRA